MSSLMKTSAAEQISGNSFGSSDQNFLSVSLCGIIHTCMYISDPSISPTLQHYMKNSTVSGNKFLCCTHTDTIERARARTDSRGCPPSPGGSTQIGCQMLQTAALITAFYEYITFYVHPNTDLFPFAQNQRGHAFLCMLRKKYGKKKSTNKLDW